MSLEILNLYIFIFSTLLNLRLGLKFIVSMFQNPPTKINLSTIELTLVGLSISYIITYLITK
jgi:hypothetical protein